jgi:biotin carboxylase
MSQKTILMMGGSAQQVPAIKAAKALGYRTVLCDYLPDNPVQYVCDEWYQASTTDVESVNNIAKKENVDGILPYASDPAALPAAIVAERLGLPTNPAKSVEILGVKHKFRAFLLENGFPCPGNFTFSPSDNLETIKARVAKLKFPIVIKPTDSSGSKGVSFLTTVDELAAAIKHADEYSRNKIIIAEEFIVRGYPYVVGGDIFVESGKIVLFGDMEGLRDDGGKSLIPIGGNGLNGLQNTNLRRELQHLISALDIKFGELNIEVLIDTENQPHFLEIGPRAGGNMIPIQLSDAYNVDLIKANILAAMGVSVNLNPIEPKDCVMTFVLHSHKDGIFDSVEFDAEVEPYIYRKCIYKQPGDKVEAFDGTGKALGIIFLRIPTVEQMNDIEHRIDSLIKVKLKITTTQLINCISAYYARLDVLNIKEVA